MTEWFDELKVNYPYMANEIFDKGFNKYLEKEKEQIINSFKSGMDYAEFSVPPNWNNEWEEYYNQTYNQNK